eukprot:TRINITY_DN3072_c0_g1_i1.p1 TRINITY_DN3072_c0_g1~~TRINITY_DN3072_c0_g1_i1.p1  ORF type:complete len:334 (-),score=71.14 TRINITY_DN3072_c0_g1_i1:338-1339(-)
MALSFFQRRLIPRHATRAFRSLSQSKELGEDCWGKKQRLSFAVNDQDYPDPNTCMGALAKHFAGALPCQLIDLITHEVLQSKGFDKSNTLFAHSTCPDEINTSNESDDLIVLLKRRWQGAFPLGGLGGIPFTGETGWAAFSAHVPDDGNILLMFSPHVGISNEGKMGFVGRKGQALDTTACGAAMGALGAVSAGGKPSGSPFDTQMDFILDMTVKNFDKIQSAEVPIYALTHLLYDVQVDHLRQMVHTHQLKQQGQQLHPVAVLGGIQINTTDPIPDHFLPLMFEVHSPVNDRGDATNQDNWKIEDCLAALTEHLPSEFGHYGSETLSFTDPI